MADTALLKKLNIKPGESVRLLNPPDGYSQFFSPLPDCSELVDNGQADLALLFAATQAQLAQFTQEVINAVKTGGRLWVAYPKKSSGMKSDLSRDIGWEPFTNAGYEGVMLISIDERWSAFRLRPSAEIKATNRSAPVPREQRPELIVPAHLAAFLAANPKAQSTFEKFPYTHRKEHINWIEDAKKPETRARRVQKAIEMILSKAQPG